MTRVKFLAHIVFDLLIFSSLCLAEWGLRKWVKPYKRGFFCEDDSLRYPFRENTVSVKALISIVLAVPGCVIVAIELLKNTNTTTTSTGNEKRKANAASNKGCQLGQRFMHCYRQIGYYLFGLALTLITTSITKYSVGRLRPFFFAICQPQMADGTTCSDIINRNRYIEDYECMSRNVSSLGLEQLRQSFPSGHTSMFFYSMVYLSIYVQATLSTRTSKLFKHLLQFVFIMMAWYVALTRISDYWHHWSDVLAGTILGTLIAFAVALYISHLFVRRPLRPGGNSGSMSPAAAAVAKSLPAKPAISPSSSTSKSVNTSPVLPAYTFGTLPYLTHPQAAAAVAAAAAAQQHAQYAAAAQTYHNYGYVP